MENALLFSLMLLPAVITSVVVALNAKTLNARWRERRDAKLTAKRPA